MSEPRGIANCNPGNLRRSPTQWQGMAAAQSDPDFVIFTAPHWGIRALAMTLLAYYRRHGLNTVRGIINRWAPPDDDNDTAAYVAAVAKSCAVVSDNPLTVDEPLLLARLCAAIIRQENGAQPYALTLIANAVAAALGPEPTLDPPAAPPP